jgi:hypothetical protein
MPSALEIYNHAEANGFFQKKIGEEKKRIRDTIAAFETRLKAVADPAMPGTEAEFYFQLRETCKDMNNTSDWRSPYAYTWRYSSHAIRYAINAKRERRTEWYHDPILIELGWLKRTSEADKKKIGEKADYSRSNIKKLVTKSDPHGWDPGKTLAAWWTIIGAFESWSESAAALTPGASGYSEIDILVKLAGMLGEIFAEVEVESEKSEAYKKILAKIKKGGFAKSGVDRAPITWGAWLAGLGGVQDMKRKWVSGDYSRKKKEAAGAEEEEAETPFVENVEDQIEERRFQEQCFLINHFKEICKYNTCTSYWDPGKTLLNKRKIQAKLAASYKQSTGADMDEAAAEKLLNALYKGESGTTIASDLVSDSGAEHIHRKTKNFLSSIDKDPTLFYDPPMGFVCMNMDSHALISRLTVQKGLIDPFMDMKPSDIATLQPRMRFFKLEYPEAEAKDPVEKEIIFSSFTETSSIEEVFSNARARADGVGVKSFRFTNLGSSEADVNIHCKLSVYFRNMEDLASVHQNNFKRYASFMDLILFGPEKFLTNPNPMGAGSLRNWNPDYYELKVLLGWSAPETTNVISSKVEDYIRRTSLTMRLTLLQHKFNFKEDGSGTLDLEFQGWFESHAKSLDADILALSKPMKKRIRNLEKRRQELINEKNEMKRKIQDAIEQIPASERESVSYQFSQVMDAGTDAIRSFAESVIFPMLPGEPMSLDRASDSGRIEAADKEVQKAEDAIDFAASELRTMRYEALLDRLVTSDRVFYIDVDREDLGKLSRGQVKRKHFAKLRTGDDAALEKGGLTRDEIDKLKRAMAPLDTSRIMRQRDLLSEEDLKKLLTIPAEDDATFDPEAETPAFKKLNKQKGKDKYRINYFYLGDLIWHAMDMTVTSEMKKMHRSRVMLGPVLIMDPVTQRVYKVNLADIPISLNLFMVWFLNRVVRPSLSKYNFHDFIRDVTNDLVLSALGSGCYADYPFRPRFNSLAIEAPAGNLGRDRVPKPRDGRVDSVSEIARARAASVSAKKVSKLYFYNYIFVSLALPQELKGNAVEDANRGIYHFFVGSDKGILKGVTFSKVDQPGIREARTTMEGVDPVAAQLRHQYNVKIKCLGNTLFKPGMYVHVNPRISGGRANALRSLTYKLGLGGYMVIVKVENIIEPGRFETILHGINEGHMPGLSHRTAPSAGRPRGAGKKVRVMKTENLRRTCDQIEYIGKVVETSG